MSSRAIPPAFQLTEEQRVAQARAYFDTHRARQLALYYPPDSISDVSESPRIGCWTDPPFVLTKIVRAFEFGEILDEDSLGIVTNDLQYIVDIAQEQLLYWHLAELTTVTNHPTDQLILWSKSDYLWFFHIPPRREEYINQLRHGNHLYYIDQVRISYEDIQIKILEIRLIEGIITPPRLVITEGREFLYTWATFRWDTSLANPDHSTVNPRLHQLPPEDPDDPELVELLEARFEQRAAQAQALPSLLARIQAEDLPPSTPGTPSAPPSNDGWGHSTNTCWCNNECCTCGYRPDTPPTPPSVVLWTPGQQHLPFRE